MIGKKGSDNMSNNLITVQLSLKDVIRLKQTYSHLIDLLPFKVLVGKNTWYVSNNFIKMINNLK